MQVHYIRQIEVGDTKFEVHHYEEVKSQADQKAELRAHMITLVLCVGPMALLMIMTYIGK